MEKSAFLKIAAQASEGGDFLNIFVRVWGFSGSFFFIEIFLLKKCVFHFGAWGINDEEKMEKLL